MWQSQRPFYGWGDVLVSLSRSDTFFKEILSQLKLEVKDIANVVYWQTAVKKELRQNKHFLDTSHLKMSGESAGLGFWLFTAFSNFRSI